MEAESLKQRMLEYWRFIEHFSYNGGNLSKTLEALEDKVWNSDGLEISIGLREHQIDAAAFWSFHNLVWRNLMGRDVDGRLPDELLDEFRMGMHNAFLAVKLATGISEPLEAIEIDIIGVIKAAGVRLTTEEILDALQHAKLKHGDSTVKLRLARMVAEKKLDNTRRGENKGYGMPGAQYTPSTN